MSSRDPQLLPTMTYWPARIYRAGPVNPAVAAKRRRATRTGERTPGDPDAIRRIKISLGLGIRRLPAVHAYRAQLKAAIRPRIFADRSIAPPDLGPARPQWTGPRRFPEIRVDRQGRPFMGSPATADLWAVLVADSGRVRSLPDALKIAKRLGVDGAKVTELWRLADQRIGTGDPARSVAPHFNRDRRVRGDVAKSPRVHGGTRREA